MKNQENETMESTQVITPEAILGHWQGHRQLTRKVIEVFPEKEFFNYSIGGMRTFSAIVMELIAIAGPGVKGIATGEWKQLDETSSLTTKNEVLRLWDETTEQINNYWKEIKPTRFQESEVAFGVYEGEIYSHLLYFIDNEIHHRGQAYVYLRSLGIEPPAFWLRSF
ncbi:MAG: DinB family protein [Bacteroidota bacterium]|nr:DinB family protein [Bacteroidota bacterium]